MDRVYPSFHAVMALYSSPPPSPPLPYSVFPKKIRMRLPLIAVHSFFQTVPCPNERLAAHPEHLLKEENNALDPR